MIIHFHNSSVANSGDVKRISNIDRAFATCYRDRTLEVVFYPFRKIGSLRKMDRFKVSEFTKQKLRIPLLPRSHVLNVYYRSLILGLLCLIYRPKVFIGEMAFPLHLVGAIKRMSPRTRVFADFHGAVVDEYLYQNPDIDEKRLARILETDRYTARAADYVLCQSDEMKRYLIDKYGVRPEKVQVYRCGYDASLFVLDRSSRTRTRQALGVAQDDVLFVYSGGLHKWQKIEDSLRLFAAYHRRQPRSAMLVLTGSGDLLAETLSKEVFAGIRDVVVTRSVPFREVPAYLNACDIAFLIRDNHTMNAVASPTKLAEYLACGLPVISSEVSRYWVTPEAEGFLLMYDKATILQDIDDILATVDREAVSRYAFDHLSLSLDEKNLKDFLNKIESTSE